MKGSCLCGNVTFEVTGEVLRTSACHCTMCRKQSGHVWASGSVRPDDISIHGDVRWFRASEKAERGSCPACGSFLFWRPADLSDVAFALGAIDGPTGLVLDRHIFTAEKGDYYAIADGLPQS